MTEITLRGKRFPILFSLNAMEEIQKRYDSIDRLGAMLAGPGEIAWLLSLVINEGLKLRAYEYGAAAERVTPDYIAMLLTPADLTDGPLLEGIVQALNEGLGGEKNLEAGELTTIGKQVLGI